MALLPSPALEVAAARVALDDVLASTEQRAEYLGVARHHHRFKTLYFFHDFTASVSAFRIKSVRVGFGHTSARVCSATQ